MSRIMASLTMVSETSGRSSYSLASRRQRPSQPSVRSATGRPALFAGFLATMAESDSHGRLPVKRCHVIF